MSTKAFGCFFCEGYARNPAGVCAVCGSPINIGDDLVGLLIEGYSTVTILGRGFYGWTLRSHDKYQEFAIKIVPYHRLHAGQYDDSEARALALCSPHRNIGRFYRAIDQDIQIRGVTMAVRCLICEFIENAIPLDEFLSQPASIFSRSDIASILTGIVSGLARIHSRDLWHDDLHGKNILIRKVDEDENLPDKYEVKIIDLGSAREQSDEDSEAGERGDYAYLAKHIYALSSRFEQSVQLLTPSDRAFADRLRRLAHRVADPDVTRRKLSPVEIKSEIEHIVNTVSTANQFPDFREMLLQSRVSLQEPLENTNALTLAPQDIVLLFTDTLDWTRQLNKSEAVIVTGPRGCGKTMLFRYLSLASQARPRGNEQKASEVALRMNKEPVIGFLVSCVDLRTPFVRSEYKKLHSIDPHLAEDFCREFINGRLVLEVVRSILWLKSEALAPVTEEDLSALKTLVVELLGRHTQGLAQHHGLEALGEAIERHVIALSRFGSQVDFRPSSLAADDILIRLSEAVRAIAWAARKEVWFLLDDYSVTVLPEFVQQAYNPVLFRLSPNHRVKISSEGDGPVLSDTLGRKYQEGRELRKVNLGELYFRATENRGREFIEAILGARFKAVGKGSLEEMRATLGEHEHERGFGSYILSKKRPGDTRFYGFGLLCSLCSGDVSFIIELMNVLMSDRWGGRPISPKGQDGIAKAYAHRQLADLRRVADYGQQLHAFAMKVGSLLRDYLVRSNCKNSADERLRIEVEGVGELSAEALRMQTALLRHSVLVDGGSGKSRDGAPTRRFFFRRLFAPCFPFSTARKGCIPLVLSDYQRWLEDPGAIWTDAVDSDYLF